MKVLIIYALAGIGHKKTAEAIYNAFRVIQKSGTEVLLVDALDHTNRLFRWLYPNGYLFLVSHLPHLWGLLYHLVDNKVGRFLNNIGAKRLKRYLKETSPDVIIATHFFPAGAAASLKKVDVLKAKLVTVITDIYPHSFWIYPMVDRYIAGMELTMTDLKRRGIDEGKIEVLGIPIDLNFSIDFDKETLYCRMGLKPRLFTILITGGGFGMGHLYKIASHIEYRLSHQGYQIIIVCGNNKHLYRDAVRLASHSRVPMRVYGFIDNMNELMTIADVLVTKPGGVTIFEAFARGLPIIVSSSIPGQEAKNCEAVVHSNAGIMAKRTKEIGDILQTVFRTEDANQWHQMRENSRKLAKPNAAKEIAALATELAEEL